MDDLDKKLLTLLSANARESVANLARHLNITRSTVYDRMTKLEESGVIAGYTIRETETYARDKIIAHVMISAEAKHAAHLPHDLKNITEIKSLHTVSGVYDFMATVRTGTTHEMDVVLDKIGALEGVEKTMSSIVLSMKFER